MAGHRAKRLRTCSTSQNISAEEQPEQLLKIYIEHLKEDVITARKDKDEVIREIERSKNIYKKLMYLFLAFLLSLLGHDVWMYIIPK